MRKKKEQKLMIANPPKLIDAAREARSVDTQNKFSYSEGFHEGYLLAEEKTLRDCYFMVHGKFYPIKD